jgi:hypothetical protein
MRMSAHRAAGACVRACEDATKKSKKKKRRLQNGTIFLFRMHKN